MVLYTVATDMDRLNPDSGGGVSARQHPAVQHPQRGERFKLGAEISALEGYVTDYISCFTVEMGRQPTYEEYSPPLT